MKHHVSGTSIEAQDVVGPGDRADGTFDLDPSLPVEPPQIIEKPTVAVSTAEEQHAAVPRGHRVTGAGAWAGNLESHPSDVGIESPGIGVGLAERAAAEHQRPAIPGCGPDSGARGRTIRDEAPTTVDQLPGSPQTLAVLRRPADEKPSISGANQGLFPEGWRRLIATNSNPGRIVHRLGRPRSAHHIGIDAAVENTVAVQVASTAEDVARVGNQIPVAVRHVSRRHVADVRNSVAVAVSGLTCVGDPVAVAIVEETAGVRNQIPVAIRSPHRDLLAITDAVAIAIEDARPAVSTRIRSAMDPDDPVQGNRRCIEATPGLDSAIGKNEPGGVHIVVHAARKTGDAVFRRRDVDHDHDGPIGGDGDGLGEGHSNHAERRAWKDDRLPIEKHEILAFRPDLAAVDIQMQLDHDLERSAGTRPSEFETGEHGIAGRKRGREIVALGEAGRGASAERNAGEPPLEELESRIHVHRDVARGVASSSRVNDGPGSVTTGCDLEPRGGWPHAVGVPEGGEGGQNERREQDAISPSSWPA